MTSIRGLFSAQSRKAKKFVLHTMRGDTENDFQGDSSDNDTEFSPFARQLTITTKKLIRRHTKKFRSRGQKGFAKLSLLCYFFSIYDCLILFNLWNFFVLNFGLKKNILLESQRGKNCLLNLFIYQ